MSQGKRIVVLWSGGVDSTYLIQRCCEEPAYEEVLAGYVELENNPAKTASELGAIERLVPLLQRSDKFVWLGTLMRVHFRRTNPNLAFKQIPIWLLALVEAIHPPVDEVAIGYIRNPHPGTIDASSHLDDLRRLYADYRPLLHRDPPALVFPLAEVEKQEIWERLDPELRSHCVYCEAPLLDGDAYRPCGRCRLCAERPPAMRGGA